MSFPGGGIYHATKYAVEAISDALRFEVKGFGVDVVLIEPGLITTEFADTASGSVGETPPGPYAKFNDHVAKMTVAAYKGPMSKLGAGPEAVAKTIAGALKSGTPKGGYPDTPSPHLSSQQQ